jgi:PAS domain S-box-containing protein
VSYNLQLVPAAPDPQHDPYEQDIWLIVDAIPTLAWAARPDGSADFFNQRWLDYTGLAAEEARDWGWTIALHSNDLNGMVIYWRSVLASGEPGEIEARLRRYDGVYRWFLFRAIPSSDNEGRVVKWFGTNTDIEDRKLAEGLLSGANLVLEMTVKGESLESTLESLCQVVEQAVSWMIGCKRSTNLTVGNLRARSSGRKRSSEIPGCFLGGGSMNWVKRSFALLILSTTALIANGSNLQEPADGLAPAHTSAVDAGETVQAKTARAMSAGPANVASGTRITDTDAQVQMVVLREGNNGFTCTPGNPKVVADPPMCVDMPALQWYADAKAHRPKPTNTVPGITYISRRHSAQRLGTQ